MSFFLFLSLWYVHIDYGVVWFNSFLLENFKNQIEISFLQVQTRYKYYFVCQFSTNKLCQITLTTWKESLTVDGISFWFMALMVRLSKQVVCEFIILFQMNIRSLFVVEIIVEVECSSVTGKISDAEDFSVLGNVVHDVRNVLHSSVYDFKCTHIHLVSYYMPIK